MFQLEHSPEYRPQATTRGLEKYEQEINSKLQQLPPGEHIQIGRGDLGGDSVISRKQFTLTAGDPVIICDGDGSTRSANGTDIWTLCMSREGYQYGWQPLNVSGVKFFGPICVRIGVTNRTPDGFILNLKVPGAQKEAFSYNSQPGLLVQSGDYLLSQWVIELHEKIQEAPIFQVQVDRLKNAINQALEAAKSIGSKYQIPVGRNYQNAPKMARHQGYFCRFELKVEDAQAKHLVFVAKGGSTAVIRSDETLDEMLIHQPRIIREGETLIFGTGVKGQQPTWF